MNSPDPIEQTRLLLSRPALIRPFERFLQIEAASGIVLLLAALVALVWANSPAASLYEHLWHLPLEVRLGDWRWSQSLHFVINDMAMTVFFLVVGLEIRRELHDGVLADLRSAALPVIAATGGVIMPAVIYLLINDDPVARNGWSIPTATDIAFALGVLTLLGKRVPNSLRAMLLALAIIDDIFAIVIIALFYSSGMAFSGFVIAGLGVLLVFGFQSLGVRSAWPYVVPGAVVWFGVLQAQVHPAIAGVILGLITPVRQLAPSETLAEIATNALARIRGETRRDPHVLAEPVKRLAIVQREILSPAERVQMALHPWVAFGIMPLFALANSGVTIEQGRILFGDPVMLGVIAGLCLGKPIGITLASLLAVRLRIAALPPGATFRGVFIVGCLGGIGFTMAIFIAHLAFARPELLNSAKLAILVASTTSGVVGLLIGYLLLRDRRA